MTDRQLTSASVAAILGILPATWRGYVSRGIAPEPDGWHDGRTPYWNESTIRAWRETRKRR